MVFSPEYNFNLSNSQYIIYRIMSIQEKYQIQFIFTSLYAVVSDVNNYHFRDYNRSEVLTYQF